MLGLSLPLSYAHWEICLLQEGGLRFLGCTFSCVTVEGRVVDSNMNGFSNFPGNLFAILVYYPEVGHVGLQIVVGKNAFEYYTGDMSNEFFYSISQTSA